MKPILKWTGGKTSELLEIKKHMPKNFETYVEPFVGGGAVFFNLEHQKNIINDFNKELILFYSNINSSIIKEILCEFSYYYQDINILKNSDFIKIELFDLFLQKELAAKNKLIEKVNLLNISEGKNKLDENETTKIINSAYSASLYYFYREKYNKYVLSNDYCMERIACWFLMRELAFSGMFRFSKAGKFNVPFGGQSYCNKNIKKKIEQFDVYISSDFYKNTEFNNGDFQLFFEKYDYFDENCFMFLDPPYDSEFSQYNKEEDFTKEDQIRLEKCLQNTKAKWMNVIKKTDFIFDLYKKWNIVEFDKNYSVNFKNRNNGKVEHLIIKNY